MESSRAARRHRSRPSRRRPPLYTALACVALVGVTAAGAVYVKAGAQPGTGVVSSTVAPSASSTAPGPAAASASAEGPQEGEASVEPVAEPTVDHDALLTAAMKTVSVADSATVSVAVLDLESGASATYGDGAFDTASIVKVDILATLLLQAQDAGTRLTAREKSYATAMIEDSDNDAASALWRDIGGADGLNAANERFGLTGTQGGEGPLWGLTQTTAADQLTLLQQVFGADSELSEASRRYLRGLMGQIAADQRWGVSVVADGSGWALKNGWLPRGTTGLWDINSIGRVTVDGQGCLVAVLSKGNATKAQGISLVEAAARAAVPVVTAAGASGSASASPVSSASAAAVSSAR
ncbi:serine hydrolase [Streptomyces sp. NPDC006332]|uniref:serine hydrolase n=1 Tax=Streptomyces sp. NPDC006332 TaxID=3155456 RepID=UPI0033B9F7C2